MGKRAETTCSLPDVLQNTQRGLKTERDLAKAEDGGAIFKHTESDLGYMDSAVQLAVCPSV